VGLRVPTRPIVVATHPFMPNPHIASPQLRYHRRRDPRFARLTILGTTMFRYPVLMKDARAGRVDVLLVDADKWRRYTAPDFDPRGDVIRNAMARSYTDQSTGEVFPAVDLAGFRADLRFIEENFRRAREPRFSKNTVWVLVNKALDR
jgi:hypothetical protein